MEQGEPETCRDTEGLSDVLNAQELGSSTNAETLKSLFEAAYLKHDI
jgi:hypothetical protein